jgi:hypothetical protein
MTLTVAGLSFVLLVIGMLLKARITRKWPVYFVSAQTAVFPKISPICLSIADEAVEEESDKTQTKNWVIARRMEWWTLKVPHCKKCKAKLERNEVIGLVLAAVCSVTALLVAPPSEVSLGIVLYLGFGYPVWAGARIFQRGIVFFRSQGSLIMVRVRHREYFDHLEAMNPLVVNRNPLA